MWSGRLTNVHIADIIDIRCNGENEKFTIVYTLKNDTNNLTFFCNGTGTVDEKMTLYQNREAFIGSKATVKFYERTSNGLPFHAHVIGVRDYE